MTCGIISKFDAFVASYSAFKIVELKINYQLLLLYLSSSCSSQTVVGLTCVEPGESRQLFVFTEYVL